jgi:hypothetical protein
LIDISNYGVYVATRNDTDDVIYVGCTWSSMKERLRDHVNRLKSNKHYNSGLQKFWNAKGLTFTHVVRCLPIKKLALAFEKAYGAQYDFKKLVNVNPLGQETPEYDKSGKNHPFYGKHHTDENKEKNRIAHLGNIPWNKGIECPKHSERMSGENNPVAILTEHDVFEIKSYLVVFGHIRGFIPRLARVYGVHPQTIRHIKNNNSWTHVKVPGWID